MDCFPLGRHRLDNVQEADELLMAMALHTLADDLAFQNVEGGEQGCNSVALVIMGHGAGAPFLHWHSRLGAVQRLDLAFLIDRKNNGRLGGLT